MEMKRHTPTRITIHHTATPQKPDRSLRDKMQALQNFSQNAGTLGNGRPKLAWPDVPYHYYIAANGEVAEGREVQFVGDTNTEYDPTGHALVVLEGNFEVEQPTEAQLASLRRMIAWLAARYRVSPDRIGGHKDFASTLCPGKNLQSKLPELCQEAN
jgi:N-acetyl-anhydromuramyl-L-alanine amidase AmpD